MCAGTSAPRPGCCQAPTGATRSWSPTRSGRFCRRWRAPCWRSARAAATTCRSFSAGVRWIGVEPNPFFHDRLRARGERLRIDVDVRAATAEALPAADHSVDAVVSSLVLCSVRDPEATLREVRRVLRPGGRFVFVEHVAAAHGTGLRVAQRAVRPVWRALSDGCHPDRDTGRLIEAAGLRRRRPAPVQAAGPDHGTAHRRRRPGVARRPW